ncbi:glycerol-3-phosphate dehydrogenase [Vibrio astriarenae]|uniref:Glycerol-3-phosphate dehydrogenase n=1 Tax=Vibrio astriarenae TaxID=1481923 RepID=A0A7Z2T4H9_9VIBR|nr:glycerol-3-phosphate dehydrogenase [Vibrio astriarenae]QIA64057.1 glycerol-3-phosphate dehydrogenase [Vibrio astriarenae]
MNGRTNPHSTAKQPLDIVVIGGGINGAGIAAEAATRGSKVAIFDAADFASATSSASSKLIHGGLRYLEHYEFRLVSEALAEREVLLQKAPHLAFPMRFRLPHRPFLRPAWMIRAGLFLYDTLGKRPITGREESALAASQRVNLSDTGLFKPEIKIGFEYSDCWVDDARLVLANLQTARSHQAIVNNYSRVERAVREQGLWKVTVHNQRSNRKETYYCKSLVNAAGPWVKQFYDHGLESPSPRNIRLIQGSHIVVPKIHDNDEAYILQNKDGRIVFVIPYLGKYSMIGTTDQEYHGEPREVTITDGEVDYLIDVVNQHFVHDVQKSDVVWTFSGVRPLCDDESDSPQAITRDYTLELEQELDEAPLLSIFGGKLTTYRKLSQAAIEKLTPYLPNIQAAKESTLPLFGGDMEANLHDFMLQLEVMYPFIDKDQLHRYARQYGSQVHQLLEGIKSLEQLGTHFGASLFQHEIDFLMNTEWAHHTDDIIWRRTKVGLELSQEQIRAIDDYVSQQHQKLSYLV